MEESYQGAKIDVRPPEEKVKDWKHEELFGFSSVPLEWEELTDANLPSYPKRFQDGSGACGPFAMSVVLGRNEEKENGHYAILDPGYLYPQRSNRPEAGMNMIDLFELCKAYGMPEDPTMRADNHDDAWLDAVSYTPQDVANATKYRGKSYVFVQKNIDAIAQVIAQGHTPIFIVRCESDEWTERPIVRHPEKTSGFAINHFNPWIHFGLLSGEKVLVSQDSWGKNYGRNGLRFIDQDFIDKRIEVVAYLVDLPNTAPVERPRYNFKNFMTYAITGYKNGKPVYNPKMMNNPDVKALQEVLKHQGYMDAKIPSTGNFLDQTRLSVMKLQRAQAIASEADIVEANGACRYKTLAWLNKYYGMYSS